MTFVESLKSRRFNSAFVGRDGDQKPLVWEDGSTLQDLGLIVLISDPNISKMLSGLHLVVCQSKTKHYLKTALLQYMAIRFMSTLRGSQQLSSCERK